MFASVTDAQPAGDAREATGSEYIIDASRYSAAVRLMESLLHDVRNPLNALAINAEVLVEKLKDDKGDVPPGQEKNLRAIREQIQRVDGVLRQFAQFIAPAKGPAEVNLSELVERALVVLGHESRRGRVKLQSVVAPDVRVHVADAGGMSFLMFRPIMRAIDRTQAGGEVRVKLETQNSAVLLSVHGGDGSEPDAHLRPALETLAQRSGAQLRFEGPDFTLCLPLA